MTENTNEILFGQIRSAIDASMDGDFKLFAYHSNIAKSIAETIGEDCYITTVYALMTGLDTLRCVAYDRFNHGKEKKSEYGLVHAYVRDNLFDKGFCKAKRLESGRVPDFIKIENGVEFPVECKVIFTERSLRQLTCYMNEMNVNKGFAIATSKTIDLPENITYIEVGK